MIKLIKKQKLFDYSECNKPTVSSGVSIQSPKNIYTHGENIQLECLTADGYTNEGSNTATCNDGSFAITFKCYQSKNFFLLFCIGILMIHCV